MSNQICLIYNHIPKTAGSTLSNALSGLFSDEEIVTMGWGSPTWQESIENVKAMPLEIRQRLRLVRGHQAFGIHRYLPQNCLYFSMLREPIERALSHYFWDNRNTASSAELISRLSAARLKYKQGGGADGFENYSNIMTRWLSNNLFDETYESDHAMLQTAISRLYLMHVGLQSKFTESVAYLESITGWKITCSTNEKVNKGRPLLDSIPEEDLAFLAELNALDVELYSMATLKYSNQLLMRR